MIKALAEVLDKPIAAVSLLEAIAISTKGKGRVKAALEAGRGDVYTGEYEVKPTKKLRRRARVLSRQDSSKHCKNNLIVTPDSTLFESLRARNIEHSSKQSSRQNPEQHVELAQYPSAGLIAQIGWQKIQAGQTVTSIALEANYLHRTDAELFPKPK